MDVVSAGGASLPKAETVSLTDGVDVCRRRNTSCRHAGQEARAAAPAPSLTFLSCPSGESDRKLALTSSRSEPLELTEVTLRASPLSPPPPPPPPPWYGL